MTDSDTIIFW